MKTIIITGATNTGKSHFLNNLDKSLLQKINHIDSDNNFKDTQKKDKLNIITTQSTVFLNEIEEDFLIFHVQKTKDPIFETILKTISRLVQTL